MQDLPLIKKLVRRHRAELTGLIGPFRLRPTDGARNLVHLVTRDGARFAVTVSRGDPDWLCVNAPDGTAVATLY